ncbi:MAG TPA: rhodanese-like domain-containing protein, partial [Candidatus Eisenbacteria bacterium]|nr:rhodanese-like domain-containing protein [Candidatus Eisenbacteria bacterium]
MDRTGGPDHRRAGATGVTAIDPAAALAARDRIVLDVREDDAFARGHLAGAGNLPRREFTERRTELPPRDAAVLVVAA